MSASSFASPRRLALVLAGITLAAVLVPLRAARAEDALRRRAFLGVQMAPLTADDRVRLRLAPDAPGVLVKGVVPGGTAEAAGLAAGDALELVGGVACRQATDVGPVVTTRKAGDTLSVVWRHGARRMARTLRMKGAPLETGDGYDVEYSSVASAGGRLRTIWTRPRTPGRHPALLLIQGIGLFSVEATPGTWTGYAGIVRDFTQRGYVTLRVDKPGCGDSEGGPLRDADFDVQTDGFRQALLALRADPGVDPDRILVFGHSMGGVWAPLVAEDVPVAGIAVYGTLCRTWTEYVLENTRRQSELAGRDAASIARSLTLEAAATHYLCREGLSPAQMVERDTTLKAWVDSTLVRGTYYSGCSIPFFRQLAAKNLGEAWERYPGRVLALWGAGDFLSSREDHELIARIVNAAHPGQARFRELAGVDHVFSPAATPAESFAQWTTPQRPVLPAVADALREWSEEVNGGTK